MHSGTGKRYGEQQERGELSVWGGIVSARLKDYAGALNAEPQAVLSAVDREEIAPVVDTADAKGRGSDRERPTEPALRCLAFTREDFRQLVAAVAPGKADKEPAAAGR
jgi:hypothetical protein